MSQVLRMAVTADGRPHYVIAAAAEVNPSRFSQILTGKLMPSEKVRSRIASVLGWPSEVLFPDAPDLDTAVARAIDSAPALPDEAKAVLAATRFPDGES